ncbi:pentatricopeptide repeat domain-containing protein [Spizellomyces punctatus DAOM BR117]|uniref:Pentatricopeptide repeat domain-containing protein n=1 Tax=Spizellomyces punctatus (strain DAOM BR117) TaxID=645134 RepID=A0A0L0HJ41_SPIPD|nr:pentatricopeptide repeat domain-containing protein [Spizellomyces punctatus DAOM BR117]KND00915.1 pentatricopeptide repeat domain-containing protein [Spizellomyces punctatus DAOM BR117]|eukprot:XP_016608954.1 pentatricopeptide repeat domain-containing protein [Spizellomyces punctatus DAOM BR117]
MRTMRGCRAYLSAGVVDGISHASTVSCSFAQRRGLHASASKSERHLAESLYMYTHRVAGPGRKYFVPRFPLAHPFSKRFSSGPSEPVEISSELVPQFRTALKGSNNMEVCWKLFLTITTAASTLSELTHADYRHLLVRLRTYAHRSRLERLRRVLDQIQLAGLHRSAFEWNSELDVLVHHGQYEEARATYDKMIEANIEPDVDTYNIMTRCEATAANPDAAKHWIKEMRANGHSPHIIAYSNLAKAYIAAGDIHGMMQVLDLMKENGLTPGPDTYHILVRYCITKGNAEGAMMLLGMLVAEGHVPSVELYSSLLSVYVDNADIESTERIWRGMADVGVKPDTEAYEALLRGYVGREDEMKVREILSHMSSHGMVLSLQAYISLMEMYGKLQNNGEMRKWYKKMRAAGIAPNIKVLQVLDRYHYERNESKAFVRLLKDIGDSHIAGTETSVRQFILMRLDRASGRKDIRYAKWLYDIGKRLGSMPPDHIHLKVAEKAAADGQYDFGLRCLSDIQFRKRRNQMCEGYDRVMRLLLPGLELEDRIRLFEIGISVGTTLSMKSEEHIRQVLHSAARYRQLLPAIRRYVQSSGGLRLSRNMRTMVAEALQEHDIDGAADLLGEMGPRFFQSEGVPLLNGKQILQKLLESGDMQKTFDWSQRLAPFGIYLTTWQANRLLEYLLAHGRIDDVKRLMFRMDEARKSHQIDASPNQITYNIILNGLASQHDHKLFNKYWAQLQHATRSSPDQFSYAARIKFNLNNDDMQAAEKDLKRLETKFGTVDMRIWTLFISYYLKRGDIAGARAIFSRIERRGQAPNTVMFTMLLNFHLKRAEFEQLNAIAVEMNEKNVKLNQVSYTALISAAAKQGDPAQAQRLLLKMKAEGLKPDVINYTAMIAAYAADRDAEGARTAYQQLLDAGLTPTMMTMNTVLSASARTGDAALVHSFLVQMEQHGVTPDSSTYETLWQGYAVAGNVPEMEKALNSYLRMAGHAKVDLGVFNKLLRGHARAGNIPGALECLKGLYAAGCTPDARTFTAMMEVCARGGDVLGVGEWIGKAEMAGIKLDAKAIAIVVDGFIKSGNVDAAWSVVRRVTTVNLDAAVFHPFVDLYAGLQDVAKMHEVLQEMYEHGVKPNVVTWTCVINGLSKAGLANQGVKIWSAMRTGGVVTHDTLQWKVDPLADEELQAGCGPLIAVVFDAFGFGDMVKEAKRYWAQLKSEGKALNENHLASYVECLSRCGLVDEAYDIVVKGDGPQAGTKTFGTLLSMLMREQRLDWARDVLNLIEHQGVWVMDAVKRKYPGLVEDILSVEVIENGTRTHYYPD